MSMDAEEILVRVISHPWNPCHQWSLAWVSSTVDTSVREVPHWSSHSCGYRMIRRDHRQIVFAVAA